jgi:hypothetical protein
MVVLFSSCTFFLLQTTLKKTTLVFTFRQVFRILFLSPGKIPGVSRVFANYQVTFKSALFLAIRTRIKLILHTNRKGGFPGFFGSRNKSRDKNRSQ